MQTIRKTPFQAASVIYRSLPRFRQKQLGWTVVLMFCGAVAELATIGAVVPFLAIVAPGPNTRFQRVSHAIEPIAILLGLPLLTTAALLLIGIVVISAAVRLILTHQAERMVFVLASDLSIRVYDRILHQPYPYHVQSSSGRVVASIEKVQHAFNNALLPAIMGCTAAIIAAFILAGLLWVDWFSSLTGGLLMVTLYVCVNRLTRSRLYRHADIIATSVVERIQTLQEGAGGIRDVLLDRSQPIVVARFATIEERYRRAQSSIHFIAAAPRFLIEAAGIVLIAVLTLLMVGRPGGLAVALPALGALALGAQRLLPLLQQVYNSTIRIYGSSGMLDDLASLLELDSGTAQVSVPLPTFTDVLVFDDVSFTYATAVTPALHGINLIIPRGARIGLVGRSGAGKSTLVDLVLGLLEPSTGQVLVDGRPLDARTRHAWQAQVAHVPQAIFLADASIAANIAFGRNESDVDPLAVEAAAHGAGLHAFVATLPDGYATMVGEQAIRLSGGQRQRIAIARALFKDAKVLVLDEATSALDDETEAEVIASIAALPADLTVIAIAHRTSTLRMCDTLIRLDEGRIVSSGAFSNVIGADVRA